MSSNEYRATNIPTFIHAADLHLDRAMKGLRSGEFMPTGAEGHPTRQALEKLVDLAIEKRVDFVLLAGDIFDGDVRGDYASRHFFTRQMKRLEASAIRVAAIAGNHDAVARISHSLPLPANVTMLGSDKAETVFYEDLGVCIHGQSFAHQKVTENLAASYPSAEGGYFNIGLLHTALEGSEDHGRYAPCTVAELLAKRYDYWALGHVHQRRIVNEKPFIVFPGNIQGLHIKETDQKGCYVVNASPNGDVSMEFHGTDQLRWMQYSLNVSDFNDIESMLEAAAQAVLEERQKLAVPLAVRVRLTGITPFHDDLLCQRVKWEQTLVANLAGEVWLEGLKLPLSAQQSASGDASGLFHALLESSGGDQLLKNAIEETKAALKTPLDRLRTFDDAKFEDDWYAEVLEEAKAVLAKSWNGSTEK